MPDTTTADGAAQLEAVFAAQREAEQHLFGPHDPAADGIFAEAEARSYLRAAACLRRAAGVLDQLGAASKIPSAPDNPLASMSGTGEPSRDDLAQAAAEHIARDLIPAQDLQNASPWVTVSYPDDRRPPRDVGAIKAALLNGECWTSWMDDQVIVAMHAIRA